MSAENQIEGRVIHSEDNSNLEVTELYIFVNGKGVFVARTPRVCCVLEKGDDVVAILKDGRPGMAYPKSVVGSVIVLDSKKCGDCAVFTEGICRSRVPGLYKQDGRK